MKALLMRLAAVGLGLAVAASILEFGLRLLGAGATAEAPRTVAVYEPHGSQANNPSRRKAPEPEPDARRFRVLVIGDSFTWGTGVYAEDTYARRLEILLERMNPALDVELAIYSRPGWNTVLEYEAVEHNVKIGAEDVAAPDLILLGYCLNDAESRHREGLEPLTRPLDRRQPRTALGRFAVRHSRIVALVWNRLENTRQRRAFERYYRRIYELESWQHAQEALDRFRELAWRLKAPLVAVVFPVFDQQFDANYSYAVQHERALEALRERDILTLDLLEAYRGIDTLRLAVKPFSDPHPNELAHRIASQALADFLVEQELVPVSREQRDRVELSLPGKGALKTP